MKDTAKMQAKKEKLSRLFKLAWQLIRSEKLSLSKAMRKAWVLFTAIRENYRFQPNMFDPTTLEIICRSEYVGSLTILDDAYVNAKNRLNSSKIFKNRHDAIKFAISMQKTGGAGQLPLI